jgi:hypothetical protein
LEGSQRKSKRKGTSWEGTIKPKAHTGVLIGTLFCVVGGAMLAASFVLPWAQYTDPISHEISRTFYIHDLYNYLATLNGPNYKFLVAYVIALAGVVCAILAALELLGERGVERFRRISPPGALASAIIAAACTLLVIYFLNTDIFSNITERSAYGSAVFMSVFGSVLAVAGGLVMSTDYRHRMGSGSGFRATSGGKDLKAALKPTKRYGRMTWEKEAEDKELRNEILASKESRDAKEACEEGDECCPACNSPVQSNWKLCPICGTELK